MFLIHNEGMVYGIIEASIDAQHCGDRLGQLWPAGFGVRPRETTGDATHLHKVKKSVGRLGAGRAVVIATIDHPSCVTTRVLENVPNLRRAEVGFACRPGWLPTLRSTPHSAWRARGWRRPPIPWDQQMHGVPIGYPSASRSDKPYPRHLIIRERQVSEPIRAGHRRTLFVVATSTKRRVRG